MRGRRTRESLGSEHDVRPLERRDGLMRELVTMWKSSRMIALTAVVAFAYAAALIPFKNNGVPPPISIRPAQFIPPVSSLLFGPAAAWGSAFGNLVGDFFGRLTLVSLFGVVGNFLL